MITWKSPGISDLFSLEGLTEPGWSAADAGEVDHIPTERFPALIALMNEEDGPVQKYVRNQAAIYLAEWGREEGVRYIEAEVSKPLSERPATHVHRMGSFDITPELFMRALTGYWALKSDEGEGSAAADLVRPALIKILKLAYTEQFEVHDILIRQTDNWYEGRRIIDDSSLFQGYLRAMLDQRESGYHGWKPKEAVKFFDKYDPEFLATELRARGLKRSDFQ